MSDDALCDLIPDCGQPQWPGWRWLVLLALILQLWLTAQIAFGADADQLRPPRVRPARPQITRLLSRKGPGHD